MNTNQIPLSNEKTNYTFLLTMVAIELVLILAVFIGERIYKSKHDKTLETVKDIENKANNLYLEELDK